MIEKCENVVGMDNPRRERGRRRKLFRNSQFTTLDLTHSNHNRIYHSKCVENFSWVEFVKIFLSFLSFLHVAGNRRGEQDDFDEGCELSTQKEIFQHFPHPLWRSSHQGIGKDGKIKIEMILQLRIWTLRVCVWNDDKVWKISQHEVNKNWQQMTWAVRLVCVCEFVCFQAIFHIFRPTLNLDEIEFSPSTCSFAIIVRNGNFRLINPHLTTLLHKLPSLEGWIELHVNQITRWYISTPQKFENCVETSKTQKSQKFFSDQTEMWRKSIQEPR